MRKVVHIALVVCIFVTILIVAPLSFRAGATAPRRGAAPSTPTVTTRRTAAPAKPTFGKVTNTPIGFTPSTMTTGDFTGHHRNDVLVAGGTTIKVLPNNGNGTFGTAVTTTTSVSVGDVGVGDLNGDGKLDLAIVNGGTSMYVLLGNGDGSFQTAVAYSAALFGDLRID